MDYQQFKNEMDKKDAIIEAQTKRKREQVYRRAAENVFKYSHGCCYSIAVAANRNFNSVNKELVPEFFMFKPKTNEASSNLWWTTTDNGFNSRILALLFCAEMCKPKTKRR